MAGDGNTESRSEVTFAVTLTVLVLSLVLVTLRLISRVYIVRRVALEDYLIVVAWLIGAGLAISICFATFRGLGKHSSAILPEWQRPLRQAEYAFSILYNPALIITKASILTFYLTLSQNQKVFRRLSIATLVVVILPGIALTVLNIAQCRPVTAAFSPTIPEGAKCTDLLTLFLSSAPVNILTDCAILFLPIPVLSGMRLPRKQKQVLIFVFALGGFVTIVDVVRIAYLQQATYSRLLNYASSGSNTEGRDREDVDFAWYASLSFMWSAVEVHVGIICACIPTIKPLVIRLLPRLLRDGSQDITEKRQSDAGVGFRQEPAPQQAVLPDHFRNSGLGVLPSPESRSRSVSTAGDPHQLESQATSNGIDLTHEASANGGSTGSKPEAEHQEMSFMDFITTPDMNLEDNSPTQLRTPQMQENLRDKRASRGSRFSHARSSRTVNPTFFDFVTMQGPKSMVKLTNREAFKPLAYVTILFFLWGFAYGFLSILNSQFQKVVRLTDWEIIGLHAAYYGGYLIAPPTFGLYTLKKMGFKATFIVGLCVYSCGTLIFWPSAVLTSVPAFFFSNFIVGLGVSTLEVAANPFIALCGPHEYAEIRLNLAQAVQAVGSVLSPLLARKVLFKNVLDAPSLVDVQWAYLAIALFDILLAVGFYYMHIPEASDDDLEEVASHNPAYGQKLFGYDLVLVTLALGVASQFLYVGGQEAVAGMFESFTMLVRPNTTETHAFNFHLVNYAVFAAARFLGAWAMFVLTPRVVLLISYIGCVVFTGVCMVATGDAGVAMVILATCFEAAIWPIIFAITLRGLGKRTKFGSALLTAGASGGCVIPVFFKLVANKRGLQYANCISVVTFALGALYPIYLNFYGPARKQVDPVQIEFHNAIVSPHFNRISRTWGSRQERTGNGSPTTPTHHHHHRFSFPGRGGMHNSLSLPKTDEAESPTSRDENPEKLWSRLTRHYHKPRSSSSAEIGNASPKADL